MEIERKFLVRELPEGLERYPHGEIRQGYLCREPVVRVRRTAESSGEVRCTLTYKGEGLMAREEYNLPLTEEAFFHLAEKADGECIRKTRYRIPYGERLIELDLFENVFVDSPEPLVMAEVEFPDLSSCEMFQPPEWFGRDVTDDVRYHNSNMIGV